MLVEIDLEECQLIDYQKEISKSDHHEIFYWRKFN
jgi:hypothetical protein